MYKHNKKHDEKDQKNKIFRKRDEDHELMHLENEKFEKILGKIYMNKIENEKKVVELYLKALEKIEDVYQKTKFIDSVLSEEFSKTIISAILANHKKGKNRIRDMTVRELKSIMFNLCNKPHEEEKNIFPRYTDLDEKEIAERNFIHGMQEAVNDTYNGSESRLPSEKRNKKY